MLTVLRSSFGPLAKTWRADGSVSGYSSGNSYEATQVQAHGLQELLEQLSRLALDPSACVIRGTRNARSVAEVLPAYNARRHAEGKPVASLAADQVLRINELFDDLPLPWVMIDVDKYTAGNTDHFIEQCLPVAFHDVSYVWQLSASHGHPSRSGTLSCHLWFWLDTPVTGEQLRAQHWPGVDPSVFRRVQPHYTADPLVEPGAPVPPTPRIGLRRRGRDSVPLVLETPLQAPRAFKPLPEGLDVAAVERDLRAALSLVPADDRNVWIAVGTYLQNLGELGFRIWSEWSAKSEKFDEEGLAEWDTLRADTVDHRAVFELAKDHGWATGGPKVDPAVVFGGAHAQQSAQGVPVVPAPQSATAAVAVTEMPGTESALAQAFAAAVPDVLRWTPTHEWMVRAPGAAVWAPDDMMVRNRLMRAVAQNAGMGQTASTIKTLGSYRTVVNAIKEAATYECLQVLPQRWDEHGWELNTPGGVVDLRTGTMRCHAPSDLHTKVTGCPMQDGPRPLWDAYLARAFNGHTETIEFMQRSIGVWLSGTYARDVKTFWYLWGPGDSGKSIMTDTISAIMGSYARVLAPSALIKHSGAQPHSTDIAMLLGSRLAVTPELPDGEPLNQSLLKGLTGETNYSARGIAKDATDIPMRQSHVLSGNHKMRLPGGDRALGRRLLLVPMLNSIPLHEQDAELLSKLRAEGPAILAWAVEGARKWFAEGCGKRALRVPAWIQRESDEYIMEENDVMLWISECCEYGETYSARLMDLYASFKSWKAQRGEPAAAIKTFSVRLDDAGVRKVKRSIMYAEGVRLRGLPC